MRRQGRQNKASAERRRRLLKINPADLYSKSGGDKKFKNLNMCILFLIRAIMLLRMISNIFSCFSSPGYHRCRACSYSYEYDLLLEPLSVKSDRAAVTDGLQVNPSAPVSESRSASDRRNSSTVSSSLPLFCMGTQCTTFSVLWFVSLFSFSSSFWKK